MNDNIKYLYTAASRGSHPGLERMLAALSEMGNPQNSLKAVNVTGTNGKGSFCAMLASVLSQKYTVGVFSSPFLEKINESVSVNGNDICDSELSEMIEYVKPFAEKFNLTQFEILCSIAIKYFYEKKVDIAVMEVGMGGKKDATNVFSENLMSVITEVSLDHMNFLGNSVDEIATEKSGIIKSKCPVYYGGSNESVRKIISDTAREQGSEMFCRMSRPHIISASPSKTVFSCNGLNMSMNFGGLYQTENAAKVFDCLEILSKQGYTVDCRQIINGFSIVRRRARFEVFSENPYVIFDGGHNPECIDAFISSFEYYFKTAKTDLIVGIMADKDCNYMAKALSHIAQNVYAVTPDNLRALPAKELKKTFDSLCVRCEECSSFSEAIQKQRGHGEMLCCIGSLYSYKDFKKALVN